MPKITTIKTDYLQKPKSEQKEQTQKSPNKCI